MAVVQISRIQQRRGRKLSNTGFPQLASGEIGWAIDTQELYIGNGAVSEGAPYVGNTQILTEHVNILDFAEAYQYQRKNPVIQTGPTFLTPIQRTIQERLDDRVSVKAFGALGDGVTDDTEALQRAIDQLYLNVATRTNETSRVILYFEPGEYIISEELRIPPYTHLMGSGIDSTVIHLIGTGAGGSVMRMVAGDSLGDGSYIEFESMTALERPKYITIERMTIRTNLEDAIILLDNLKISKFHLVKFEGQFDNGGSPIGLIPGETRFQTGVFSRSTGGAFRPEHVQFHSCIFYKTGFGFYSNEHHNNITFFDCQFDNLYDAISIGGGSDIDYDGAHNTKIDNCHFDLVDRYGIHVKFGYGNTSSNNKFELVGNENEGYANATHPIIRFDTKNNQSVGDFFQRNRKLKDQTEFGLIAFHPNVKTTGLVTDPTTFVKTIETTPTVPIEFSRFPVYASATYIIDYVIKKNTIGDAIRTGTIHLTIDYPNQQYHIQDDYSYVGSTTVENIVFSATTEDYDGDLVRETLVLRMFNPTGNGIGTMNYSYRMMTE